LFIGIRGKEGKKREKRPGAGLYHPASAEAIAEPEKPLKKRQTSNFNGFRRNLA
jgi:hypothetical protein